MWKHIAWGNGRCCSRIVVDNRGCPKKCLCEIICDFVIIAGSPFSAKAAKNCGKCIQQASKWRPTF